MENSRPGGVLMLLFYLIVFISLLTLSILFRNRKKNIFSSYDRKNHGLLPLYGFSSVISDFIFSRKRLSDFIIRNKKSNSFNRKLAFLNPGKKINDIFYEHLQKIIAYLLATTMAVCLIGAVYTLKSYTDKIEYIKTLDRPGYGDGSQNLSLMADSDIYKGPVDFTIKEKTFSQQEAFDLFSRYKTSLDLCVLGDNKDFSHIVSAINLPVSIGDENISITWSIDKPEIIDYTGQIIKEDIPDSGNDVILTAELSLDSHKASVQYNLKVYPISSDPKLEFTELIENFINSSSKLSKKKITLPDNINGINTVFYKANTYSSPWIFMGLWLIFSVLMVFLLKNNISKSVKRRNQQVLEDYPEIISKFTLLSKAGLSISNAFFKIADDYSKQFISDSGKKSLLSKKKFQNTPEKRFAYEEMIVTCKKLKSGGLGEFEYTDYGRRIGIPCYIKFGNLLANNLKKGTRDFLLLLQEEVNSALSEKKNTILKKGELAGTKLLFPMLLIFLVILIIVMIPAFMSISF